MTPTAPDAPELAGSCLVLAIGLAIGWLALWLAPVVDAWMVRS